MSLLVSVLLLLGSAFAVGAARASTPGDPAIVQESNLAVPMRDGALLRADVLRPSGKGPFPTLVYRTPYGKHNVLQEFTTFRRAVERGYAVVVQDVRGRYASGGVFTAYRNEGRDGYDTIEWAARQPWSTGSIGTFGLSYPAAVQWLAAVESPPHLKAMVPAMTFSTPRQFFYSSGVWDMSWIDWIWNNIAPDTRARRNLPGPHTIEGARAEWKQQREHYQRALPLLALDIFTAVAPYYYEWLRHSPDDSWWDWAELRDKYPRVQAAVLNLSGWYDEDYGPEGATTNFLGLLASRGPGDPRTKLLLGPWVHGVEETGITHSGEREFGPDARIDYDEVVLGWMDHYVRGINNAVDRRAPVRLFVMGDNRWCDEPSWPPPAARSTSFFLAGGGPKSTRGKLQPAAPAAEQVTVFTADPNHPVVDPYGGELGGHDYRDLAQRADVLVFDTDPLPRDVETIGPVTAEIFASCDCPDFDLWTRLLDVAPDGSAFNLMSPGSDVLRASYREPGRRALLQPGQPYKLILPNMRVGNRFKAGHRIRVQISASFFPAFSRNMQTGEPESTSAAARPAGIRIYHDAQHASRLVLPVIPQ
jgi:putative CocE/NonD family hydrolase